MPTPTVVYYEIFLEIPTAQSLKEKRGFLKGPLERIRRKLNVAIIEAAEQDVWNAATLAAVTVGTAPEVVEGTLRAVLRELELSPGLTLRDWTQESL